MLKGIDSMQQAQYKCTLRTFRLFLLCFGPIYATALYVFLHFSIQPAQEVQLRSNPFRCLGLFAAWAKAEACVFIAMQQTNSIKLNSDENEMEPQSTHRKRSPLAEFVYIYVYL